MKTHQHSGPRLSLSRRKFLMAALAAGTAIPASTALVRPLHAAGRGNRSPNERLNLAVIGLGGQGLYDMREASNFHGEPSENIVALCDVDAQHLDRAAAKEPRAKKFDDYRRVL